MRDFFNAVVSSIKAELNGFAAIISENIILIAIMSVLLIVALGILFAYMEKQSGPKPKKEERPEGVFDKIAGKIVDKVMISEEKDALRTKDYRALLENWEIEPVSFGQIRKILPPEAWIDIHRSHEFLESNENRLLKNTYDNCTVAGLTIDRPTSIAHFKIVLE